MIVKLPPAFSLVALDQTGSTNDEMRLRVEQGAGHGLTIMAAEQTAGRGRRGRAWFSPRGNLHCSILLDGGPESTRVAELAFVAAIALRDALASLAPSAHFTCKWPNDVLGNGAKVAGMLLENIAPLVILGVGVNLVAAPSEAIYPAASLASFGAVIQPEQALEAFLAHLDVWYGTWRNQGFGAIRRAWLDRAGGLSSAIVVRLADSTTLSGQFADLDEQGALLLDLPEGGRRRVLAGDVFFAA